MSKEASLTQRANPGSEKQKQQQEESCWFPRVLSLTRNLLDHFKMASEVCLLCSLQARGLVGGKLAFFFNPEKLQFLFIFT